MPNSRIKLLSLLIAASALLVGQSSANLPVKEHVLSNGMKVLFVQRNDQPTIAAGWIARVGSANERPGITGLAHLFEHMMFKGSKTIGTKDIKRDLQLNDLQDQLRNEIRREDSMLRAKQLRGEIADMTDPKNRSERHQKLMVEFEKLVKEQQDLLVKDEFSKVYTQAGGTGLNAFTNSDVTCYVQTIPSNKLELWAWMESDRLYNPVFREFYKERDVVFEERRLRTESTPTGKFGELFESIVWEAHPYHWPVVGWGSDLASITREQALEFFNTYYAPNNLTAVLVGDVNESEVVPMLEKYFGRIPRNPKGVPEVVTLEPKQIAEKRMVAEAETTPSVEIAWKSVALGHKDMYALDLLASVLNGRSGRLYKNIVLEKKLATNLRAGGESRKYGGVFTVQGTVSGEHKPEEVEQAIYQEIEKIKSAGISEQELQKVKNQIQADSFRRLDNNYFLMVQLAVADAITGYKEFIEAPSKYEKVTVADIQRVANDYFSKENRNVAIYNRKASAKPVDPELAAFPDQIRSMIASQMNRLSKITDLAQLKTIVGQMEAQAAQVPAEMKGAIDYLRKKIETQIQELSKKENK
ncbi:MAG: M16 family metallopeptidase [Holophagaceae bacterium]|jgi:predicted Zn-dependent peptidase